MTESSRTQCTSVECACDRQGQTPHHRRALFLSWLTVLYNLGEGLFAVVFGLGAGSVALIGFGLDSFVESLSGGVMIWRFSQKSLTEAEEAAVERKASRYVAYTLFALGAYVAFGGARSLLSGEMPEKSLPGIVIAIVSLIAMPLLFIAKRRTGNKLSSQSLLADSKQTLACIFLSAALLAGLGLNYALGLWWADPAAGLVIAGFILREGYKTYTEQELCEC